MSLSKPAAFLRRPLIAVAAVGLVGYACWLTQHRSKLPLSNSASSPTAVPSSNLGQRVKLPAVFVDVTESTQLRFVHDSGPFENYFFPQIMGSGGALFDFDQDGDLDIYLLQGGGRITDQAKSAGAATNRPRHQLFRQEPGGTFRNVSPGSGLDLASVGMGVAIADVNNDGWPDVFLANYGPNQLLLNQADGTFRDVSQSADIENPGWGSSACFLDFDRDGWLDLCVVNYVDYDPGQVCADQRGHADYCNPKLFQGTATKLYRNITGTTALTASGPRLPRFQDVSLESGIGQVRGPGLGVVSADLNDDGWPDLFVANDGAASHLWINQKNSTFAEEAVIRGVAYDTQGRAQAGMGIAMGDVDHNGTLDLFVTHLRGEANSLYLNDPATGFRESSTQWGLGLPSFHLTGFGAALFDLELDGDLDLVIVNGDVRRLETALPPPPGHMPQSTFKALYGQPNQIFMHDGQNTFLELDPEHQAFCQFSEVSRGLMKGDIDNDGDIDLVVTNTHGPARVFRNESAPRNHWLSVRAIEPKLWGRDAYGAKIVVQVAGRQWTSVIDPGGSYLSSSDPRAHFGLGNQLRYSTVQVTWPNGDVETFPGGDSDRFITVRHGEGISHDDK